MSNVFLRGNQSTTINDNRLHSPNMWYDCPFINGNDGAEGIYFFDDFLRFQEPTTGENNGTYRVLDTGDSTLTLSGAYPGGALAILVTTDNEDAGITLGDTGTGGGPFVIPDNTGEASVHTNAVGKLWFECRVKKTSIADALGGFFVGLAEPAALAADFIADAGADFADVDLLGFWNDETNSSSGATVNAVTQKTGADFDTIIAGVDTLVADTWVKYGFIYDPNGKATKRIKFFVNGLEQSTYVGENSGDATVYLGDTTNFPGDEEMTLIAYLSAASGSDCTLSLDWWACAQLMDG
jgi:hypothetical protein